MPDILYPSSFQLACPPLVDFRVVARLEECIVHHFEMIPRICSVCFVLLVCSGYGGIDDYVHRIGRTARGMSGAVGHALIFYEFDPKMEGGSTFMGFCGNVVD